MDEGSKIDKLVSVMALWGIPWMEILEKIRSDSTGKERDRTRGEQESIS